MYIPKSTPPDFPVGLNTPVLSASTYPYTVNEHVHADLLNLKGLESDPRPIEGKCTIEVQAWQLPIPTAHPDCVCPVKVVNAHTPFIMENVLDVPRGRKSVIINIKRLRWRCKTCGKVVTQPLTCMAEGHYKMTQPLLEYIEVQSLLVTELSLSEETGVFVRKIREIRAEFVKRLRAEVKFDTPYVLGLDGVRADEKRRRVMFTDIEAGLALDVLASGSSDSIADRIREFPGWQKIGIFTIDMCKTLRAAVLKVRFDAIIIIDLYHIMRRGNEVMDKVRRRKYPIQKTKREPGQKLRPRPEPFRKRRVARSKADKEHMKYWFGECAELELAYNLKEDFMEIFDERTYSGSLLMCKTAARRFYMKWLENLPVGEEYKDLLKDFEKITVTMKNWGEYVFNYFDYKQWYTNAFTESMNRKLRDILRDARGCSYETLRARVVFGHYLRKRLRADRELEMEAIMPRLKRRRRRQQNKKGKGAPKKGQGREGNSREYVLPDNRQMPLIFPAPQEEDSGTNEEGREMLESDSDENSMKAA
jgi:transposase